MYKPKIYMETSAVNFVFADDAPDKRDDTVKLFEEIKQRKYEAFAGYHVIAEINKAGRELREKLLALLKDNNVVVLPPNDDIHYLADLYVKEGIIPLKYRDDAVHIATASYYGMDIIISWNFKHIVKRKTILMTGIVNAREGYKQVSIHSPSEVIEYEE
jgi:predicted nucleic acid-binding protein